MFSMEKPFPRIKEKTTNQLNNKHTTKLDPSPSSPRKKPPD